MINFFKKNSGRLAALAWGLAACLFDVGWLWAMDVFHMSGRPWRWLAIALACLAATMCCFFVAWHCLFGRRAIDEAVFRQIKLSRRRFEPGDLVVALSPHPLPGSARARIKRMWDEAWRSRRLAPPIFMVFECIEDVYAVKPPDAEDLRKSGGFRAWLKRRIGR